MANKLTVVAVSDRAVGAFNRPFFAPSKGAAIRSFIDEVNRAESPMAQHPEDYELHYLGEWDEDNAHFATDPEKYAVLMRAKDAVRKES